MQSDVPEVSELCWLLMTGTPMGLLERCHRLQRQEGQGAVGRRRAVHLSGAAWRPTSWPTTATPCRSATIRCSTSKSAATWPAASIISSARRFVMPKAKVLDDVGPRAGHRRREDVEELQQHARRVRRRQGAAEADHADRHRLAADGTAERAGRRCAVRSVLARRARSRPRQRWPPSTAAAASATAK